MEWAVPQFERSRVDAAGATLVAPANSRMMLDQALTIINNWRSSHSYPLNTFQVTLRTKARSVDNGALVAQRIKRLSSIRTKLQKQTTRLRQMNDIGGCRAIVHNVEHVHELVRLYTNSSLRHELIDVDDYISTPRPSGYRSVHLIYRYFSDKKKKYYNGLKIEMQLRSIPQHAWATAVETVGTVLGQALKASQGKQEWLRFFALMGTVIANFEGTSLVPGAPTDQTQLVNELRYLENHLQVPTTLEAFAALVDREFDVRDAHYFLLRLDTTEREITVTGFKQSESEIAMDRYLEIEQEIADREGLEAVLVSVDSLMTLRRAYPNYFLNTDVFLMILNKALSA